MFELVGVEKDVFGSSMVLSGDMGEVVLVSTWSGTDEGRGDGGVGDGGVV